MTDDVRAALRALATDGCVDGDGGPAAVVDEAETACGDARDAAAFLVDGGLDRLRAAVDRADSETARRGRRTLDDLRRFRLAVADHFRSGRGTVLSPGEKRSER
ncbi:hypothetical protein [Haloplanus salilacus]|uniref:hypothetical protein n=1 Tax=Haloplanus salilacus TaxID=2949994 RepID=UPI0030D17010